MFDPDQLPPVVRQLLGEAVAWEGDRQRAEYDQSPDEVWQELDTHVYRIIADLVVALEVEAGFTETSPWREGERKMACPRPMEGEK